MSNPRKRPRENSRRTWATALKRWITKTPDKLKLDPTPRERELAVLEAMEDPDKYYDELKRGLSGVLLSDQIMLHSEKYGLIEPLDRTLLKPAAYELRIGALCSIGGEKRILYNGPGTESQLTIEPFEVAVIQTLERLNMPRYLIARWNVRVRWAYEGLLWVGGPQVDPGYQGHLFCPLYNLSDRPVTLQYGEPIAAIDFVPTTPFRAGASREYKRPRDRERLIFDDYQRPRSALYEFARKKIDEFDERLKDIQARIDQYSAITFAALAILVAAIAAVAGKEARFSLWDLSFGIAVLAIGLQLWCLYYLRVTTQLYRVQTSGRRSGRFWSVLVLAVLPALFATAFLAYWVANRVIVTAATYQVERLKGQEESDIKDVRTKLKEIRTEIPAR